MSGPNQTLQVLIALGGASGLISLAWQFYERILAKPKLEIKVDSITWRLAYTPKSWAWIPRYASKTLCNPYGTVISIPILNKGRRMATNCRAKMRFRIIDLFGEDFKLNKWSRWFELHWSDNPEERLDSAYQPISIGVKDEAYIDLIVYHTRIPKRSTENVMVLDETSGCILTFYVKPFLRAPMTEDPCEGEPPTIEYPKPPISERLIHEVQVKVVCDNAQAHKTIYIAIYNNGKCLAIYTRSTLEELKQALQQGLEGAKPIYSYCRMSDDDPPPCIP